MKGSIAKQWREAFFKELQDDELAVKLKESALAENLGPWTTSLTAVVVMTCKQMGWPASAKAHKLDLLPVQRSEYLGLDVVAFPSAEKRWCFPVAIMELENLLHDDAIGYSLWKVMAVRADLRIVFCYRRTANEASSLLRYLREQIVEGMGLPGRLKLEGQTVVVVGCHAEAATFPYGFFKWWELENNTGKFEQIW
jgi:hypothetical protein